MKREVIEIIFDELCRKYGDKEKVVGHVVTREEVVDAIDARNERNAGGEELSVGNPANFLKDFIRHTTCNSNWPARLKAMRITARQRYGKKQVFEFIKYRDGDELPFPDRFDPIPDTKLFKVETLSLSRSARALGREDEAWLTQVVVYQRIVHQHLATLSPRPPVELSHLQMSVKTQPEIDALFLATFEKNGEDEHALVTCEAKQFGERILEDQIREQVARAFKFSKSLKKPKLDLITPMALKVHSHPTQAKGRALYLAEFARIDRATFERDYEKSLHDLPLTVASRAFYELQPPVTGISAGKTTRGGSAGERRRKSERDKTKRTSDRV